MAANGAIPSGDVRPQSIPDSRRCSASLDDGPAMGRVLALALPSQCIVDIEASISWPDEKLNMAAHEEWITPQGMAALKGEIDYLWREERPRVTEEVRIAADHGDRSENAEYKYGKLRLKEIDRRLRFLNERIEKLKVVRQPADPQGKAQFGCWVEVEDEDGEKRWYQLVGTDEVDAEKGKISTKSPIGRALFGKNVDDEVSVTTPKGELTFVILRVRNEAPNLGDA
jgi:transcription elongation factor GreB